MVLKEILKDNNVVLDLWMKLRKNDENRELVDEFIISDAKEYELDTKECIISMQNTKNLGKNIKSVLSQHDADINCDLKDENIVIIEGKNKSNNPVRLYYYEKDYNKDDTLNRQIRIYDEDGEFIYSQISMIEKNEEEYKKSDLYEGCIRYCYNEDENKILTMVEDELNGAEYFLYDDSGDERFRITEEYVETKVKEGDRQYNIVEGYIKVPVIDDENSNIICSYLPPKDIFDVEPDEIQRNVYGDVTLEEKKELINNMDINRKEKVLEVLKEMSILKDMLVVSDFVKEGVLEERIESLIEKTKKLEIRDVNKVKENKEMEGYSFEQFIKESVPKAFGEKRPLVICKDGTEYSIQASSFHYCSPREDGLEAYDEYEIGNITDWEKDNLENYRNYDDVCGYVPKEIVEEIIKAHGGLDEEIMKKRIEERKAVFKPKNNPLEKKIQEISGGNEYLANILRYATRFCEVKEQNNEAEYLYNNYEGQLPKNNQTLDNQE